MLICLQHAAELDFDFSFPPTLACVSVRARNKPFYILKILFLAQTCRLQSWFVILCRDYPTFARACSEASMTVHFTPSWTYYYFFLWAKTLFGAAKADLICSRVIHNRTQSPTCAAAWQESCTFMILTDCSCAIIRYVAAIWCKLRLKLRIAAPSSYTHAERFHLFLKYIIARFDRYYKLLCRSFLVSSCKDDCSPFQSLRLEIW